MCWNIFLRLRLSSLSSSLRRTTRTQNPPPTPTRVFEERNVEQEQEQEQEQKQSFLMAETQKEQLIVPVSVPVPHQQKEEEEELGLGCSVEESFSPLPTPDLLSVLSDPTSDDDDLPDLEPESELEIDEILDDLDNLGLEDDMEIFEEEEEEEERIEYDHDHDNAVEEYLYGGLDEYDYEDEIIEQDLEQERTTMTQVEEEEGLLGLGEDDEDGKIEVFEEEEKSEEVVVEENGEVEEKKKKKKKKKKKNLGLGKDDDDDDDGKKIEVLEEERIKKIEVKKEVGERSSSGGGRLRSNNPEFPLRPDQPDCIYYLRFKTCRYGINCRYNHPLRITRKQQQVRSTSSSKSPESEQEQSSSTLPESSSRLPESSNEVVREKEKGQERDQEQAGQLECKFYSRPGGCKFGKSCRYQHPQEKTYVGPTRELNFLGLPIRPGEKECVYYMRTGSCKYANSCRFHHPDPTDLVVMEPRYHNNRSLPIQSSGLSQPVAASWPPPRNSHEVAPFLDSSTPYVPMVPPQGMHPNLEWNGYLAQGPVNPMYTPMMNMGPLMSSLPSCGAITKKPDGFTPHQQQMPGEDFPDRPGQTECTYFMKNGDCKFKSNCKFHHPKDRAPKCILNSMGLPLRPDQIICSYYSRYGICKFGPACKYDHPPNCASSASIMSASDLEGSRNGTESLMPQSV